jgi:hypothetical protein
MFELSYLCTEQGEGATDVVERHWTKDGRVEGAAQIVVETRLCARFKGQGDFSSTSALCI